MFGCIEFRTLKLVQIFFRYSFFRSRKYSLYKNAETRVYYFISENIKNHASISTITTHSIDNYTKTSTCPLAQFAVTLLYAPGVVGFICAAVRSGCKILILWIFIPKKNVQFPSVAWNTIIKLPIIRTEGTCLYNIKIHYLRKI